MYYFGFDVYINIKQIRNIDNDKPKNIIPPIIFKTNIPIKSLKDAFLKIPIINKFIGFISKFIIKSIKILSIIVNINDKNTVNGVVISYLNNFEIIIPFNIPKSNGIIQ